MSDARLREIERRWKADPNQEHTLQYLYELIRVGYDIDLGLLDTDLLRSYRAQLQNDLRSLPLQRISILGRGLHEVMVDIQSYRHEEALADIPVDLVYHYFNISTNAAARQAANRDLVSSCAFYRTLQTATPGVDLTNEYDFEVISLSWLPAGVLIRSGSLSNALQGTNILTDDDIRGPGHAHVEHQRTDQPYLFAIIRTTYLVEVHDDLQDTTEEIVANRYYSLYYQLQTETWTPLPRSGYIYAEETPKYIGIRFNHGLSIYEIFGDLNEEGGRAEATNDEINAAHEAVEAYREQMAETIQQTHLEVWEERGYIKVDLIDLFTDVVIQSWEDETVYELINDGFFHGPVDGGPGAEFHQSVYDYAEMHQLLPWQRPQGNDETAHFHQGNPGVLRSWHAAIGPRPFKKTILLALGTYEALAKAALHFNVTYNRHDVKQETTAEGPSVPMLTVKTYDDRWLQIWQKVRGNPF